MRRKANFRKDSDYVTRFRCAGGIGILREEVWVNAKNEVVKYNLAFFCLMCLHRITVASSAMTTRMESTNGTIKAVYRRLGSRIIRLRQPVSIRGRTDQEQL